MWVPGLQMGFVLVCSQTRVVTDGLGGRAVSRLQTRSLLSLLLPLYKRLWSGQVGSTSEFTTPSFPWLKYFVIKKDQFAGLGYQLCWYPDAILSPMSPAQAWCRGWL